MAGLVDFLSSDVMDSIASLVLVGWLLCGRSRFVLGGISMAFFLHLGVDIAVPSLWFAGSVSESWVVVCGTWCRIWSLIYGGDIHLALWARTSPCATLILCLALICAMTFICCTQLCK